VLPPVAHLLQLQQVVKAAQVRLQGEVSPQQALAR